LQQSQHLLHGDTEFGSKLHIGKHEIDEESNPDLGEDGILRRSQKGLDLQILLDPLEKEFDLPSFFIEIRHGLCRNVTRVCDEGVGITGVGIDIVNEPKRFRNVTEMNGTILLDARCLPSRSLLVHTDHGIPLHSGNAKKSFWVIKDSYHV